MSSVIAAAAHVRFLVTAQFLLPNNPYKYSNLNIILLNADDHQYNELHKLSLVSIGSCYGYGRDYHFSSELAL